MGKHARNLSATITNSIQASAHVIAEASHEAVTRSTNAVQHILHYDQLPDWMKVDPYIKLGYRRPLNSFHDCFRSLFYLHNESVNIWSHLLPAFFYVAFSVGLCFYTFVGGIQVSTADGAFFQVYILCTAGCLLLSAIYHCTNSHSEHISRYFLKVDYFGILLSIIGTNVSAAYFGLYGNLLLQVFYILFFIACAALVFRILLRHDIDGPSAVFKRGAIFVSLASTGFLPFLHMYYTRGSEEGLKRFAIRHTAVMVLLDLLAFFFYATHTPERWWPHTFDIWGASHQIFHVLIDVGQVVFLLGLRKVMLRHYLHAGGPISLETSTDTSLSLWIDSSIALRSGIQPSFETGLSV